MGKLDGRVALVTGASRGQGANHCRWLAREGAKIVALDACADFDPIYPLGTRAELQQTVASCESFGVQAIAIQADVRNERQIEAAVAEAIDRLGSVDILCNNAGVCKVDGIHEMSSEVLDIVIDINVKGVFYTTKHVVPGMMERNWGRIINTASAGGLKALPYVSHYAASKGAVVMATKSWANELAPYGICVNAICPGTILSGMITGLAGQMAADPVSGDPVPLGSVDADAAYDAFNANNMLKGPRGHVVIDDISAMVVYLASEAGDRITGQAIPIDSGWTSS